MKKQDSKAKVIIFILALSIIIVVGLVFNLMVLKPEPINQDDSRAKSVLEIDPKKCIPFEHGGNWYEYIWVVGADGNSCVVEVFFGKGDKDYRQHCRVNRDAGKFSTYGYSYYRDLLKRCRTIEIKQHIDYEL